MNDDERVLDLFLKACDLVNAERRAFIDRECGDDEALRARLVALLQADERADRSEATAGFAVPVRAMATDVLTGRPAPERIGPYRILERLGEGGMGVVYRAEQTEPIRREVALKLIRGGFDSPMIVARFEAERQALALMEHPNIARVYDAGTTADGHPYFAMEYVQGRPITAYCEDERLSTRARLDLFLQICGGVQHAHHKGIIHRDLKPSNILVTAAPDSVPKIIDFGIAKAIGQDPTDRSLATQVGVPVGTLEYMSPEQAAGRSDDIDLRSDVYSLGVVLFEILSGLLPCDTRGLSMTEAVRRISDEAPVRLGTINRRLRGDLETIVHKTLEKDRSRRYSSPGALAEDINRYLDGLPIHARPSSGAYRLRKLIARQKLASALLGTLVVVAGMGFAANVTERRRAEREAQIASTVSGILTSMMRSADPLGPQGPDLTVRELIDSFDASSLDGLEARPEVEYRIRYALSGAYRSLGIMDKAYLELERCEKLLMQTRGVEDHQLGLLRTHMGWDLHELARYDEAQRRFRESMDFLGDDDAHDDEWFFGALAGLADTQTHLRQYEDARRNALDALHGIMRENPEDAHLISMLLVNLSIVEEETGHLDLAENYARRAIQASRSAPAVNFLAVRQLAQVLIANGACHGAEESLRGQLVTLEELYPQGHVSILLTNSLLGESLLCQDRYEEAEVVLRDIGPDAPGFRFLDEHETAEITDRLSHAHEGLGRPR